MQFLLFGTFWSIFLIALTVIIVVSLIEAKDDESHEYWAGFTIIIALVLLGIFGNWEFFKNILIFIRDNPWIAVGYLMIYIILGLGWSFIKWYLYLNEKRKYFRKHTYSNRDMPKFNENKSRIVAWMMYWPFSVLWNMTHNLFRDVFTFLSEQLKGAYEKIVKNMFKEFEKEEN